MTRNIKVRAQGSSEYDGLVHALNDLGLVWAPVPDGSPAVEVQVAAGDSAHTRPVPILVWTQKGPTSPSNPFVNTQVRHFVGAEPAVDAGQLRSVLRQAQTGSFIRLSEVLSPPDHLFERSVQDSSRRRALVDEFSAVLTGLKCGARLRLAMETALDELLTNALYNAPTKNGVHVFAATDRKTPVMSERPVTVRWAADPVHIAVAVRDEYGSLDPEHMLRSLARCYAFDQRQIEQKAGGAGLGFFMLLRNASRMIVNVDPGRFTEIIILRRRREHGAAFARSTPTLNVCTAQPAELRHFTRLAVDWQGSCTIAGQTVPVRIHEVSRKGAFLSFAPHVPALAVGQPLDVVIFASLRPDRTHAVRNAVPLQSLSWSFPGGFPLTVRATVRWLGHHPTLGLGGAGVEFDVERHELHLAA